jgi:hypothetical protein
MHSGQAVPRFQSVLTLVDVGCMSNPAILIALRLVTDVAVLHLSDLRAAASDAARAYRDGDACMLEWPRHGRLMDRRLLSGPLSDAIAEHKGPALRSSEWSATIQVLRRVYGSLDSRSVWSQFILDARAWWLDHLPPVVMGHVTREAVFQPLPRSALIRRAVLRRESCAATN